MEKKIVVQLNNILKIHNGRTMTLRGINLNVYEGDVIALVGPNNSGKNILGRVIGDEIKPTAGSVEYFFDTPDILSNVGYHFRKNIWPDGFRVQEVIKFYRDIYGIKDEAWISQLYEVFRIKSHLKEYLNQSDQNWLEVFSMFLAFMHKPKLLILNPITTTIWVDIRIGILDFLKKYREENNATIILTSPSDAMFDALCNRVITMHHGQIFREDSAIKIKESGTSLTDYSLKVYADIKKKDLKLKNQDPVLDAILSKFEMYEKVFDKAFNELCKKHSDEEIEQMKLFNDIKLIQINLSTTRKSIEKLAFSLISINSLKFTKKEIKELVNSIDKFIKPVKKLDPTNLYLNESIAFLEEIKDVITFCKHELIQIFNETALIHRYSSDNKTSLREKRKLKKLKRKYIKEEKQKIMNKIKKIT
ncbi:ATP-binding cassette domain-containing protein [Spiroplasma endosymbiont of Crioceris asparagi]|uniref:ATP-binding cassette domain-containing protein n=1 Tax=Spiroplasma endosymbiont of Crioceris asparagi TaxID=3066286 RepID=UPI0030CBA71A